MNTTYESSFTSDENTSLIWELLNENTKERFSYNLKNNSNPTINKFFINTINQVNKNQQQYNNIMEMNKATLLNCIKFIEKNSQYIKEPAKKDVFEIRMKKQKDEFNSLMKTNTPKEIDFADKIDNLPVDKFAVDQTLAEREKELQQITQQYVSKDAESWIKNGKQNDNNNDNNDNNDKIKIIEEPIINTIKPIPILMDNTKVEKRVTFEIKEPEEIKPKQPITNTFLDKLKKKDMYEKVVEDIAELKKDIIEIKQKFESMEANQTSILNLVSNFIKTINEKFEIK